MDDLSISYLRVHQDHHGVLAAEGQTFVFRFYLTSIWKCRRVAPFSPITQSEQINFSHLR